MGFSQGIVLYQMFFYHTGKVHLFDCVPRLAEPNVTPTQARETELIEQKPQNDWFNEYLKMISQEHQSKARTDQLYGLLKH